jgi:hypothetical protein
MRFSLSFSMDNAAFGDAPTLEVVRILETLAEAIRQSEALVPGDNLSLFDFNGNRIGEALVEE